MDKTGRRRQCLLTTGLACTAAVLSRRIPYMPAVTILAETGMACITVLVSCLIDDAIAKEKTDSPRAAAWGNALSRMSKWLKYAILLTALAETIINVKDCARLTLRYAGGNTEVNLSVRVDRAQADGAVTLQSAHTLKYYTFRTDDPSYTMEKHGKDIIVTYSRLK